MEITPIGPTYLPPAPIVHLSYVLDLAADFGQLHTQLLQSCDVVLQGVCDVGDSCERCVRAFLGVLMRDNPGAERQYKMLRL